MQKKEIILNLGAEAPFSVLHITDTHFCLADARDNERKNKLAVKRARHFEHPEENLTEACAYAKENALPILHTGDLIDFVSEANLDRAAKFICENDVMFIAGNHEFSQYVGEATEDEAYRNQSLPHVQTFFKYDIRFHARTINGINFVGIDNSYYRFDREQLEKLKAEVSRRLPIVLLMHNPLYTPELFDFAYGIHNGRCSALVGVPEEKLQTYTEAFRIPTERADAVTAETVAYIKNQSLIKAIFTGHLHNDFDSMVSDSLPQFVTGIHTMRKIDFI